MLRRISLAIAVVAFLSLPAIAFATPAHKRHIYHWHGYGFLPGYHQPPNNGVPMYRSKESIRERQTLRQATGMAADDTFSANRTFSTAAGMAAVSVLAGLIRPSG